MRVLVLGGTGMLGHSLWQECRARFDSFVTVRAARPDETPLGALDPARIVAGVRAEASETISSALAETRPEVVVNCIGIVKQARAAADRITTVRVNSLFPHELAALCERNGARLIHLSTDCVFSGRRGDYSEQDSPEPIDLYGRSKLLGEPAGTRVLTLRTSMIGWELSGSRQGLLEWFAGHEAGTRVSGYTRARFTGPTTPVLSRTIAEVIESGDELNGTWHVGAAAITKHDLLVRLRDALGIDVEVVPDESVVIDRTLDSSRFRGAAAWSPPTWDQMVTELAAAASPVRELGQPVARR
jgi:dTDP-4-dehydrorhamnose reductase